jgi:hypothetical protein
MLKEKLELRIKQIEEEIQRTINNHTLLQGHLSEARYTLAELFKAECEEHKESEAANSEAA